MGTYWPLLIALLTVLAQSGLLAAIAVIARQALLRRFGPEKLATLTGIARQAAAAVEQMAQRQGWDSATKLEHAMDWAQDLAVEHKVPINRTDLRVLIEAAVHDLDNAGAALVTLEPATTSAVPPPGTPAADRASIVDRDVFLRPEPPPRAAPAPVEPMGPAIGADGQPDPRGEQIGTGWYPPGAQPLPVYYGTFTAPAPPSPASMTALTFTGAPVPHAGETALPAKQGDHHHSSGVL